MNLVVVSSQLLIVLVEELSAYFLNLFKFVFILGLVLICLEVNLIPDFSYESLNL